MTDIRFDFIPSPSDIDGRPAYNAMYYDHDGLYIRCLVTIPRDLADETAIEEYGYMALKEIMADRLEDYSIGLDTVSWWWNDASEAHLTQAAWAPADVAVYLEDDGEVVMDGRVFHFDGREG